MKIGIDLSPLQNPHRMRGIGYTLINFLNNISENDRLKHSFTFYKIADSKSYFGDPINLFNSSNLKYEVKSISANDFSAPDASVVLPARLTLPESQQRFHSRLKHYITTGTKITKNLWKDFVGKGAIRSFGDIDIFLQTDPLKTLPRFCSFKKALIIYDIIPYILEHAYLTSYKTARLRGHTRKGSLRLQVNRLLYIHKLKINTRRADKLIAISKQTKNDFVKYLNIPSSKISIIPLGVDMPEIENFDEVSLEHYVTTSWGYTKRPLKLGENIPFILFIGGADSRRKLEDLVAAFNIIRGQGYKIKLVLAGDSMQGPDSISTMAIREALKSSSYIEDIIFMGFVNDKQRDWLYRNASMFVFPSKYEGFGLPVLEALAHSCPVISYDNEATREVANNTIIYAENLLELSNAVVKLLNVSDIERETIVANGKKQAQKYSWKETSLEIIKYITS